MTKKEAVSIDRRDFFRKVGFGAGAAAAGAAGLSATRAKAATPAKTSARSAGYRETEHVKKFYESARF